MKKILITLLLGIFVLTGYSQVWNKDVYARDYFGKNVKTVSAFGAGYHLVYADSLTGKLFSVDSILSHIYVASSAFASLADSTHIYEYWSTDTIKSTAQLYIQNKLIGLKGAQFTRGSVLVNFDSTNAFKNTIFFGVSRGGSSAYSAANRFNGVAVQGSDQQNPWGKIGYQRFGTPFNAVTASTIEYDSTYIEFYKESPSVGVQWVILYDTIFEINMGNGNYKASFSNSGKYTFATNFNLDTRFSFGPLVVNNHPGSSIFGHARTTIKDTTLHANNVYVFDSVWFANLAVSTSNSVLTMETGGRIGYKTLSELWQTNSNTLSPATTNDTVVVGATVNAGTERFGVINGTVMFSGTTGATPISGAGTRLMWIPAKAAFRAGAITSTQWDDANIGLYSFATNYDCKASGQWSTAMGSTSNATGLGSTAIGAGNNATGNYTTTVGYTNTANLDGAMAIGSLSTATAYFSLAGGYYATASSYAQFATGRYNRTGYTGTSWVATDPIFQVGNGTGTGATTMNDAARILKNGSFYLGDASGTQDEMVYGNTADSTTHFMWRVKVEGRSEANMVKIDTLNAIRLYGSAIVYDDLRGDVGTLKQVGQANKPDFNTTYFTYDLPEDTTEMLGMKFQMPHWMAYDYDSIYIHVHVLIEHDTMPDIKVDWSWTNVGDTLLAWSRLEPRELATSYTGAGKQENIITYLGVVNSGMTLSSILRVRAYRKSDAYPGDVYLDYIDIHVPKDALGSNSEYTK